MNKNTRQLVDRFYNRYGELVDESNYRISKSIPVTDINKQQVVELEIYRKKKPIIDNLMQNLKVLYTERRQLKNQVQDNMKRIEMIETRMQEVTSELENN